MITMLNSSSISYLNIALSCNIFNTCNWPWLPSTLRCNKALRSYLFNSYSYHKIVLSTLFRSCRICTRLLHGFSLENPKLSKIITKKNIFVQNCNKKLISFKLAFDTSKCCMIISRKYFQIYPFCPSNTDKIFFAIPSSRRHEKRCRIPERIVCLF